MEIILQAFKGVMSWLVELVHDFGYFGIFIMTMLESTFVPIPSEFTIVPAGYLVHQGRLEAHWVFAAGALGTLVGSLINYYLALKAGRPLILRYGKYILLNEERLHKVETFFEKYGALSTFTGRLIIGVRHFIAFPAGLARMDLKRFTIYTLLGGALWTALLIYTGYLIGYNKKLLIFWVPAIKISIAVIAALTLAYKIWSDRRAAP
jgi:membrane protein DedA with SNARE-associated domain